jgi:ribonuclease HI
MIYTLITDGAYSSLRDQGGIGVVFLKGDEEILEYSKMYKGVTNNMMELAAVIIGLRFIKNPIDSLVIVSDSQYVIGCATMNWKRKKNINLWNTFDIEYKRVQSLCKDIQWIHTKGHQKDDSIYTKWNNVVDRLAVNASQEI